MLNGAAITWRCVRVRKVLSVDFLSCVCCSHGDIGLVLVPFFFGREAGGIPWDWHSRPESHSYGFSQQEIVFCVSMLIKQKNNSYPLFPHDAST